MSPFAILSLLLLLCLYRNCSGNETREKRGKKSIFQSLPQGNVFLTQTDYIERGYTEELCLLIFLDIQCFHIFREVITRWIIFITFVLALRFL